jgi:hypothetical protein
LVDRRLQLEIFPRLLAPLDEGLQHRRQALRSLPVGPNCAG